MVTRKMARRNVPTRPTPQKRSKRRPKVTLVEKKQREQSEKDFERKLRKTADKFAQSFSNVKNIDKFSKKFIQQNISKIPPRFRDEFRKRVKSKTQAVKQKQQKFISDLQNKKKSLQKRDERMGERFQDAESPTKRANLRAGIANIRAREEAVEKVLKSLREGNILSKKDVSRYIRESGDIAGQKEFGRQISRVKQERFEKKREKALKKKQSRVNEFVEKNVLEGKTPSLLKIQKELNLDVKNAVNVQKAIRKSKENIEVARNKIEAEREKVLNDFGSDFVKKLSSLGLRPDVSYDPKVLEKKSSSNLARLFDLKGQKLQEFNQLTPEKKQALINYSTIVSAKENVPTQKQISQLREESKLLAISGYKDVESKLRNAKNINDVIKIIEKQTKQEFDKKDVEKLNRLKNTSKQEIKKAIIRGDSKKFKTLIDSIDTIEKFRVLKTENYEKKIKDLIKRIDRKLDTNLTKTQLNKLANKQMVRKKGNPVSAFVLKNMLVYLQDQKKKGKKITLKEYKDYINQINDVLGFKAIGKKLSKQRAKSSKVYFLDSLKFLGNITWEATLYIIDVVKFIGNVLKKGLKVAGKTQEWINKTYKDFIEESTEQISRKLKKLPQKDKDKLYRKTKKNLEPIVKTAKNTKELVSKLINNPEILTLALSTVVVFGAKNIRKSFIKNPAKAIGSLVGFFFEGYVFAGAIKTLKITKAVFSPFVLKSVRVFEKSPTIRGTAKFLKKLEGKKIDLFSATKESLRNLFKGSGLSKKAEQLLIKSMLKNPEAYIGNNLKIKPLKTIIKTPAQKNVINFMKKFKKGFLSGSGSLKLQLKKFRKIGDLDIVVKNPRQTAERLAKYLNSKTWLGKVTKGQRYKVRKNPNIDGVYTVWDSLGVKKYRKGRGLVDVDDLKLFKDDFKARLGKKFSKKYLRKIDGVDVLKVEPQLAKKLIISKDITTGYRAQKELADVKSILKQAKKSLSKKQYSKVKKLFDKTDNVLKVSGQKSFKGAGKDRRWFWVEKYVPDWKKLSEKGIRKRLKKVGFSDTQINKNLNLYSPDGFYFAPENLYSYFLDPKKGSVIYLKGQKISKFPQKIQKRINDNVKGLLNKRQQVKLRKDINKYLKKNPDKVFLGEKILSDSVGEFEVIAPAFTRLFPKKKLITREIYIPSLQKFIKAQEVVLGKRPTSVVKKLVQNFSNKLKKGYKVKDMKKDIINWAKKKLDDFKKSVKTTKKEKKAIENFKKTLKNEKKIISRSKLSSKQKKLLTRQINRQIKKLKPDLRGKRRLKVISSARRVLNSVRRKTGRKPLKKIRKVTKARKTTKKRKAKLRKPKPKIRPKKPRTPKRKTTPRKTKRPKAKTPRPPKIAIPKLPRVPKKPPRKIPRFKLKKATWGKKLKDKERLVNARVRKGKRTVTIRLQTTPNRALKKMKEYVDKTLTRSFDLVVVGVTKTKDIKKPDLKKFRLKRTPGSKVLKVVEKNKYALDTPSEKALLRRRRKKSSKRRKKRKK